MAHCSQNLQDHGGSAIGAFFFSEHAHCGGCKALKGAQHRLWYSAKVSRRRAVEIPLNRPNRLRAVCAGGVGEGKGECDDIIVTTPRCNFCRGRVQGALSRVLRKGEVDSESSIRLRQFHGGRSWCTPAMPSRYFPKWSSPILGNRGETIGVCTYAQLPSRDRCRLASAACFHPAASGLGFGRA